MLNDLSSNLLFSLLQQSFQILLNTYTINLQASNTISSLSSRAWPGISGTCGLTSTHLVLPSFKFPFVTWSLSRVSCKGHGYAQNLFKSLLYFLHHLIDCNKHRFLTLSCRGTRYLLIAVECFFGSAFSRLKFGCTTHRLFRLSCWIYFSIWSPYKKLPEKQKCF